MSSDESAVGASEPEACHSSGLTNWRGLGVSIRGASHVRADLPNQDAVGYEVFAGIPRGLLATLAVSDGHGSPKCPRSHTGAALAIKSALDCAKEFFRAEDNAGGSGNLKRKFERDFPSWLVSSWRSAVLTDILENPFTEDEHRVLVDGAGIAADEALRDAVTKISTPGESGPQTELAAPFHDPGAVPNSDPVSPLAKDVAPAYLAYGATILMAVVTENGVFYLQLGDGDILAVSADGVVDSPIPVDPELIANETTSLCMTDALRHCRFAFHHPDKTPPAMILASSDGYSNSFVSPSDFRRVGSDILAVIKRKGMPEGEEVKTWLGAASEQGSGDDVTLGFLFRPELSCSENEKAKRRT